VPAVFWLRLEADYRDAIARREDRERLQQSLAWLKEIPLAHMRKHGWVKKQVDKALQLEECLRFFGIASPAQWDSVVESATARYRRSTAFETDSGAVLAWLRRGQLEAQALACPPFDPDHFREALLESRALTTRPPNVFVSALVKLCAAAGVVVAFVPAPPRSRVSGATQWLNAEKAVIQLSLRYKRDDHLWFTFFHESGHILLHGRKKIFLEGPLKGRQTEVEEAEANSFASEILIPTDTYQQFLQEGEYDDEAKLREFAGRLGIAPGILVGRLQHDRFLPWSRHNRLMRRLDWAKA